MAERPFVLALTGPPGAGKTTLASLLRRRHAGARSILFDKYQPLTALSQTQVRDWFASGADLGDVDHGKIVADLKRETEARPGPGPRQLVLFETPFGRLHRETGAFIDFLVWIDTPLDIALARAVLAFTEAAQHDAAPEAARRFVNWQVQYMRFYPTLRPMYLAQRQRIAREADLSIDGSRPAATSAEIIEKALAAYGVVAPARDGR
jgi:uridine kinase